MFDSAVWRIGIRKAAHTIRSSALAFPVNTHDQSLDHMCEQTVNFCVSLGMVRDHFDFGVWVVEPKRTRRLVMKFGGYKRFSLEFLMSHEYSMMNRSRLSQHQRREDISETWEQTTTFFR